MQLAWPKLLGLRCCWTESSSGVFGLYLISILWKCLIATLWYAIYIVYAYANAQRRLFPHIEMTKNMNWKCWIKVNSGGCHARSSHNHLVSSCHHCLLDFVIILSLWALVIILSLPSLFVIYCHNIVIVSSSHQSLYTIVIILFSLLTFFIKLSPVSPLVIFVSSYQSSNSHWDHRNTENTQFQNISRSFYFKYS